MLLIIYIILSFISVGLILGGVVTKSAVPMMLGGMILFGTGALLYWSGIDRYEGETRTTSSVDANVVSIDYNITSVTADDDFSIWTLSTLMLIGAIVFMALPFGLIYSNRQT